MKQPYNIAALLVILLLAQLAQADDSPGPVLDALHQAGGASDHHAFLELMTEDGSVLGLSSDSRWTAPALTDKLTTYFAAGGTWPQPGSSRQTTISPEGEMAWFSESLKGTGGNTGRRFRRSRQDCLWLAGGAIPYLLLSGAGSIGLHCACCSYGR